MNVSVNDNGEDTLEHTLFVDNQASCGTSRDDLENKLKDQYLKVSRALTYHLNIRFIEYNSSSQTQ